MYQVSKREESLQLQKSFRNRHWSIKSPDPKFVDAFVSLGLGRKMAEVLATRANACRDPEKFLDARIKTNMFNPFELKDMDVMVDRLVSAVRARETVAIWGDYDVDGATSSAIMARYLRDLGCRTMIRIPDRLSEGYGPNIDGLRDLRNAGASLFLVLDSGTTAFDTLGQAVSEGMDILVVDHHAAEDRLPPVRALVNPNRRDEKPGRGYLCTAGLAFVVCVGLKMKLDKIGFFASRESPNVMELLDLAALGTVADVVPLEGLNRAIVKSGLSIMEKRKNLGLKALLEIAGVKGKPEPWHMGFLVGPRINAGGRIADSSMGARLLSTEDEELAASLATQLDAINKERQEIEAACLAEARRQVERLLDTDTPPAFVYAVGDFHEGVVGIVAGRLKESHDMPAIVFSRVEGGLLKASARSMPGFDIGQAIIEARLAGILVAGGGHPMAGGLTIEETKLDAFIAHMNAEISRSDFAANGVVVDIDAQLTPAEMKIDLVDAMDDLEPFGQGNSRPRFLIEGLTLDRVETVKEKHLRLNFSAPGIFQPIKSMLFNAAGQVFAETLRMSEGCRLDVVATLKRNEWRGNVSLDLVVEDARLSQSCSSVCVPAEPEERIAPEDIFI